MAIAGNAGDTNIINKLISLIIGGHVCVFLKHQNQMVDAIKDVYLVNVWAKSPLQYIHVLECVLSLCTFAHACRRLKRIKVLHPGVGRVNGCQHFDYISHTACVMVSHTE